MSEHVEDFDDYITPLVPDGQVPLAIVEPTAVEAVKAWQQQNDRSGGGDYQTLGMLEKLRDSTILNARDAVPLMREVLIALQEDYAITAIRGPAPHPLQVAYDALTPEWKALVRGD